MTKPKPKILRDLDSLSETEVRQLEEIFAPGPPSGVRGAQLAERLLESIALHQHLSGSRPN